MTTLENRPNTALVVIDVQNGVVAGAHDRDAVVGNVASLVDRARLGYVVDFVDVYWRDYHFWAFNVADSAISIGVAIMILDMLGVRAHVSKTA